MPVVSDESTLNLEFVTSGTFSAKIYGSIIDNDNFRQYPAFKMPTLDLMDGEITDGNFLYQIDLTAIDYVKVVLTAVSGELTVRGKAVG